MPTGFDSGILHFSTFLSGFVWKPMYTLSVCISFRHVCTRVRLARVLFVLLAPFSYWSCIHYVLGLVTVINQACGMRWTGVMSWSDCQASSCFAGNAKLFPEGMFFRNGRVCFTGPHRPHPVPGVLSPRKVIRWLFKSQSIELLSSFAGSVFALLFFFFLLVNEAHIK